MTSEDNAIADFKADFQTSRRSVLLSTIPIFLVQVPSTFKKVQDRGQPRPWFHGSPLFAGRPQTSRVPMFEGIIVYHILFNQNIRTSPEKKTHIELKNCSDHYTFI
jgi:hypothetical protein